MYLQDFTKFKLPGRAKLKDRYHQLILLRAIIDLRKLISEKNFRAFLLTNANLERKA